MSLLIQKLSMSSCQSFSSSSHTQVNIQVLMYMRWKFTLTGFFLGITCWTHTGSSQWEHPDVKGVDLFGNHLAHIPPFFIPVSHYHVLYRLSHSWCLFPIYHHPVFSPGDSPLTDVTGLWNVLSINSLVSPRILLYWPRNGAIRLSWEKCGPVSLCFYRLVFGMCSLMSDKGCTPSEHFPTLRTLTGTLPVMKSLMYC